MGRPHKDATVVIALDEHGHQVREDIVPNAQFAQGGSSLLNSSTMRVKDGIRMVSVRVFDPDGKRLSFELKHFNREGAPVGAFRRNPDGSIIEPLENK